MPKRRLSLALLLSVACPVAWAQGPTGAEFVINSYTTGWQWQPAAASDAGGNFVVVWTSSGQDGSDYGIFGQRFNASGAPRGSEFQVNTHTTSWQIAPAIASDANGSFVVVWNSLYQDGDSLGVFGRRFNAAGLPEGSEFQVNSYTTGAQRGPASVASGANGSFVVVWSSAYQDGSGYGVFGRRFGASGLPQGSEFQVNSYTTGAQLAPAVASDANGRFVVVWSSDGQDGSGYGVFGQPFNGSGVPQGSEFRLNSYTTSGQWQPAVAFDANGGFIVVWSSLGQDGSSSGIFGRRVNASGVPQGSEFRVNSYTTSSQVYPAVASDSTGGFVVVWSSWGQDGGGYGVFGERLNASGVPQGGEFRVNSYTADSQGNPAVTSDPNGSFVVVWTGYGQDGDSWGVLGQRYGDVIFKDGFE